MKPWILLDSAAIPGGGELGLYQHVRDFAIRVGRDELMTSRTHGSEDALAELAAARLGARPRARGLVGGLGMGFTAAAALRGLGPDGRLTVAELVPAVVAWNRGLLAHLAGDPLGDPRVDVHVGDVAALLRATVGLYDLVLLDVDNGPHGMTAGANHWLYGAAGLAAAHRALRPGGVLAVWSASPDEGFTRRLRQAGFQVEVARPRAHGAKGTRHVVWLAARAAAGMKPAARNRPSP
jgi:spermidine synthase